MQSRSRIIHLKSFVCVRFRNDTLPPMQKHVYQSSHLISVVEQDKSKNAQPVTLDWTGINYPQQWEVKYNELRDIEKTGQALATRPLRFDRSTSSFRYPDSSPAPSFSSLPRSTSVSSSSSASSQLNQPRLHTGYTGRSQHTGQHKDCQACKKNLQALQHYKDRPTLGMFTLPRQNSEIEATIQNRKSFVPGRNLPDTPFRQYSHDGQIKREYLPHKSSGPDDSVSDEVKLANWGNLQHQKTARNLDDMAMDLLQIKKTVLDKK